MNDTSNKTISYDARRQKIMNLGMRSYGDGSHNGLSSKRNLKLTEMYKSLKAQKRIHAPLVKVNGKGQLYIAKQSQFKKAPQVSNLL